MAVDVGGVRQQLVVIAPIHVAERHEFLPFGELVDVEKNLLRRIDGSLLAAENRVLFAFLRPAVEEIAALGIRRRVVGLLDPTKHLGVKRFLKLFVGRHHRVGVRVLGLEMIDDLRILLLAQPEIVIRQLVAVQPDNFRLLLRGGRSRGLGIELSECGHGEQGREDPNQLGRESGAHGYGRGSRR